MTKVQGTAWISGENVDEYWAEGEKCSIEVEVTDADEIRIGAVLAGDETESAGFYISRAEADKLSRFLAAASVTEFRVGQPA